MKVLLADDHPLFLDGLEDLLAVHGFEVLGGPGRLWIIATFASFVEVLYWSTPPRSPGGYDQQGSYKAVGTIGSPCYAAADIARPVCAALARLQAGRVRRQTWTQ